MPTMTSVYRRSALQARCCIALGLWSSGLAACAMDAGKEDASRAPTVAAPSSATSDDEAAEIAEFLSEEGFDVSDLQVRGEEVIVEGDMVFPKAGVLAGARGDKGYTGSVPRRRAGGGVGYGFEGQGCMIIDSAVSAAWKSVFQLAASNWFAAGFNIVTGTCPAGSTWIRVKYGTLAADTFAEGEVGSNSFGRSVTINSAFHGSCGTGGIEGVPNDVKAKIAMHELGHTMSFLHPPQGRHINGTASGTSYTTVMTQGCFGAFRLSDDDILSAQILVAPIP